MDGLVRIYSYAYTYIYMVYIYIYTYIYTHTHGFRVVRGRKGKEGKERGLHKGRRKNGLHMKSGATQEE
jgi:hypothetical protein